MCRIEKEVDAALLFTAGKQTCMHTHPHYYLEQKTRKINKHTHRDDSNAHTHTRARTCIRGMDAPMHRCIHVHAHLHAHVHN